MPCRRRVLTELFELPVAFCSRVERGQLGMMLALCSEGGNRKKINDPSQNPDSCARVAKFQLCDWSRYEELRSFMAGWLLLGIKVVRCVRTVRHGTKIAAYFLYKRWISY